MNLISFLTTTNDYFFSDKMLWCGISGILGTSFIFSTYVYFKILFMGFRFVIFVGILVLLDAYVLSGLRAVFSKNNTQLSN